MTRSQRALGYGVGGLAVVGIAAVAAVFVISRTEAGARMALDAATRWSGADVAFDSVHGTLADSLELRGVRIGNEALDVTIREAAFTWRPSALLGSLLHIEALKLSGVDARMTRTGASAGLRPLSLPSLPVAIRIDAFGMEQASITIGKTTQTITSAGFGGRWDGGGLGIDGFEMRLPDHAFDGDVLLRRGRPLAVEAKLHWRGALAGRPGEAQLAVSGPLDRLDLDGAFVSGQRGRVSGRLNAAADVPRFSVRFDVEPFERAAGGAPLRVGVSQVDVTGTLSAIDVDLRSSFAASAFAAQDVTVVLHAVREADPVVAWRLAFEWRADLAEAGRLAGAGDARIGAGQARFRHAVQAPYPFVLEGTVAPLSDTPVFDVTGRWQAMRIALPDREPVLLEPGELHLKGPAGNVAASGTVVASVAPAGRVATNWTGRLGRAGFRLEHASAALMGGAIDLNGEFDWSASPSGTFAFDAAGIDLGHLRPDLDTRIDAQGDGSFRVADGGLETRVNLARAQGNWRGHRLSAHTEFEIAPGRVVVRQANLALGDNTARLDGTIGDVLSGRFDVAFSDLGQFAADLGGRLTASGAVGGSLAVPFVDVVFDARDIRYADWSSPSASGAAKLDPSRETESQVKLEIDAIRRSRQDLGSLTVELDGSTGAHDVHVAFTAPGRRVVADAHGGWRKDAWSGSLDDARVVMDAVGEWTLAASAEVTIGPDTLTFSPVCLTAAQASACVRLDGWSASGGAARIEVSGLPLALTRALLPRTLVLDGTATLNGTVERRDGELSAVGAGSISNGSVRVALKPVNGGAPDDAIAIRDARFDFELTPALARLAAHADVSDWFGFDTALSYGLLDEHPIEGTLEARSTNLEWVGEFFPDVAGTRGGATLSGTFGGTVDEPRIAVDARLSDGEIRVPASGTRISQLGIRLLSPAGRRLVIEAQAHEGDGRLDIEGELALDAEAGWPGKLAISGERFPFVRLPDAEADLSPALQAGFSTAHLDIRGTLGLPRVQVDVIALPESAVSVSPDAIIVDRDAPPPDPSAEAPVDFFADRVTGDVRLVLGDAVAINAAGLSARLAGDLRWTKKRGENLGRGAGRISVAEGSYTAYTQNLRIERGDLIFAGALDNPALDVRAVRPDIDVTAGVRVSGYMTAPVFHLYSRPALPDSEILAYIVTGRGLDDASSGEAGVIAQAALSLGAERSSLVTSQLQHAFGLDEFSVNAGTTARETSLVAGKRLTPKLSVRSDFNPFDQLWSFFLNYKLTQTWSVEAESGYRQGADLIYSIERDELIPRDWFD